MSRYIQSMILLELTETYLYSIELLHGNNVKHRIEAYELAIISNLMHHN